jgi:hypothetical protein
MPEPRFPLDALRAAVTATTCMTELLEQLAVDPSPRERAAMWARLGSFGLDTSHWGRSPRAGSRKTYDDDALAQAVAASTSVYGVMRHLGIRLAGGSHHHLSRRIREVGLDVSHFTGSAHNKGQKAPRRTPEEILVVLPPSSPRLKRHLLARAMLAKGVPYCCRGCGLPGRWQGRELTLVVDHVDGEWLDNRLGNLRFLCPNCHAQTATWCRRKGS